MGQTSKEGKYAHIVHTLYDLGPARDMVATETANVGSVYHHVEGGLFAREKWTHRHNKGCSTGSAKLGDPACSWRSNTAAASPSEDLEVLYSSFLCVLQTLDRGT